MQGLSLGGISDIHKGEALSLLLPFPYPHLIFSLDHLPPGGHLDCGREQAPHQQRTSLFWPSKKTGKKDLEMKYQRTYEHKTGTTVK